MLSENRGFLFRDKLTTQNTIIRLGLRFKLHLVSFIVIGMVSLVNTTNNHASSQRVTNMSQALSRALGTSESRTKHICFPLLTTLLRTTNDASTANVELHIQVVEGTVPIELVACADIKEGERLLFNPHKVAQYNWCCDCADKRSHRRLNCFERP